MRVALALPLASVRFAPAVSPVRSWRWRTVIQSLTLVVAILAVLALAVMLYLGVRSSESISVAT